MYERIVESGIFKVFTFSNVIVSNIVMFTIENVNIICAVVLNMLALIAVVLLIAERIKKNKVNHIDIKLKKMELKQKQQEFKAWEQKNKEE